MSNEKLQEKYAEYQMLENQLKQMQKQLEHVTEKISEVEELQFSIGDLKGVSSGTEIFVPISMGIFAKATLKENDSLIVNVGNNVVVNKTVEETKSLLANQVKEMGKMHAHLVQQMEKLAIRAEELQSELQQAPKE